MGGMGQHRFLLSLVVVATAADVAVPDRRAFRWLHEAVERFAVSKSAFDFAWIWAIEETGNRHWYEPLPRSRRKTTRTRLT